MPILGWRSWSDLPVLLLSAFKERTFSAQQILDAFRPGGNISNFLTHHANGDTALSVTMAWLYWKTEGSLLLVMLMHASVNNATGIVPGMGLPQEMLKKIYWDNAERWLSSQKS